MLDESADMVRNIVILSGLAAVAVTALGFATVSVTAAPSAAQTIPTSAEPIATFGKLSAEPRFGSLLFAGGFSFDSSNDRIAGLSAVRLDGSGERFLTVTDLGHWLSGAIDRDAAGRPVGLSDVQSAPIAGIDGRPLSRKADSDAEALTRFGDRWLVAFERNHRILSYASDGWAVPHGPAEPVAIPFDKSDLVDNGGIEALTAMGGDGTGSLVAVTEASLDAQGSLLAAIVRGPSPGIFTIRKDENWDVTDADVLPDGDLLILERRYLGPGTQGARIRRIEADAVEAGAVLIDGAVIFSANIAQEIDNMEGLSVWVDAAGRTRLTLVSDDNASPLQRNLLLEFVLADDEAGR